MEVDNTMISVERVIKLVPVVKNPPDNAGDGGDAGLIFGSGRSPGGGHGNPLQYSCLESPHGPRSLVGYGAWGCKGLAELSN